MDKVYYKDQEWEIRRDYDQYIPHHDRPKKRESRSTELKKFKNKDV